jgi:dTDP-glucose 4,6-dehydratase
MKKLLVTGGCGFIGSNFIRYILETYPDYRVVNLDKLTYAGNRANLSGLEDDPRYDFVQGDICDFAVVDPLMTTADMVANFAAETHVDRSIMGGDEFVRTNVYGAYVLLDCARARGVERFLQVSTDEVYGSIEEGAWTEDWPMDPRSPYSASKASAELLTRSYFTTHDLPTLITRGSNNIGRYQYPEKRVPLYITNAIDDLSLPVYGNGLQVRDHLLVQDHCRALDLVLHQAAPGEAFNIGGDNDATGLEVARTILQMLDKPDSLIQFVEDRPGHDQRYALDSTKIQALGWKPQWDFEGALQDTVDWYVSNEEWWRNIKGGMDYKAYYQKQYGARATLAAGADAEN